jgi:hypothetical protein
MNNKSIISLIAFFFLSMFYVASASAGPTYINVDMPKECGTWKVLPATSHHCSVRGPASGKAGVDTAFKCWGGGNGKGGMALDAQHCGILYFSHEVWTTIESTQHTVQVTTGSAICRESSVHGSTDMNSGCVSTEKNTLRFHVCRPADSKCKRKHKAQVKRGY